ncbi:MAG: GNAT family N-acetyltransferase [Chloroflexi bacterium]|nr:GNAT family N-acetyltransferase [Chloroflexota bacterium]
MSRSDVTLRPARAEDCARCQAIAVAAWEPIHAERRRLLGPALYAHLHVDWRAAKAAQIARAFEQHLDWIVVACAAVPEQPGRAGLAAEQAEQVVGFVTFRLDRGQAMGTIGNNAVDPAWQGRGIATALYRHALDRFRAEGMRFACVGTGLDAGHAPALAAYRKMGFTAEVPSVMLYQEL